MGEADVGWTRHGERLVYVNRWVRVGLVDVERPDGQREDYHVVHLAPGRGRAGRRRAPAGC
jgi:ADP-ribose pyrophosphatase